MTDAPTPRDVLADILMSEGCGDSDQCERTALRALSALHTAGYVVVPTEPTTAMIVAAIERPEISGKGTFYEWIYRAMIAAAPGPKETGDEG